MTLEDRIKILAVRLGISATELGRRAGFSPQNFSQRMKRGSFTEKELSKIAEANGCQLECNFVLPNGEKV